MANNVRPLLEHHHTLLEELACHFPYAIFSVALSMILLSFMGIASADHQVLHTLFHNFHFLHLLFAGTGAVLVFRKYSPSVLGACLVGVLVPAFFCTLSDSILPLVGGYYLGLDMHFHLCFVHHTTSVIPFLLVGVLNGFAMSTHRASEQLFYSQGAHFFHILISALASMFYFVGFGFVHWQAYLGFVFLFMLLAVLLPCTLSDIVVPLYFAQKTSPCGGCHDHAQSKREKQ